MPQPLQRRIRDTNHGYVYEGAEIEITKSEWMHIHDELCFTKRFQEKYVDLFHQHLFPASRTLLKANDKIIHILMRMESREEHGIPFMNTLQLHLQTAMDVEEYMQSVDKFSSLRMHGIRENGIEGDNIEPDAIHKNWSTDQHTLDVMIQSLKYVIAHVKSTEHDPPHD